ncbi:MAG: hypothetical protein K6B41_05875 [Butyrivibrio sp.]|nr:hypothetical protein [Butyrivibrio sp.]
MNKKITAGMITSCIALILSIVGFVAYIINSNTAYFSNLGKNPTVILALLIAIVALAAWVFIGKESPAWTDILPVIAPACLFVAGITLLNTRINGMAAIMTFTNNAQNMSDMSSAIVAIVAIVIAAIIGIVSAFFDVKKAD